MRNACSAIQSALQLERCEHAVCADWRAAHFATRGRRHDVLSDFARFCNNRPTRSRLVRAQFVWREPFLFLFLFFTVHAPTRSMSMWQYVLSLLIWLLFAGWTSHLFWLYQHRRLVVPMNIQLAALAALVVSAYNAERTLRRSVPWLFVSSFFFLLADAVFGKAARVLTKKKYNSKE